MFILGKNNISNCVTLVVLQRISLLWNWRGELLRSPFKQELALWLQRMKFTASLQLLSLKDLYNIQPKTTLLPGNHSQALHTVGYQGMAPSALGRQSSALGGPKLARSAWPLRLTAQLCTLTSSLSELSRSASGAWSLFLSFTGITSLPFPPLINL